MSLNNLAYLLDSLGQYEEARPLYERGKFRAAMQNDINDICAKFGIMHDAGIREMIEYAKSFGRW